MLSCRFSFKAYAENIRGKATLEGRRDKMEGDIRGRATKCSLKTAEVLLEGDGHFVTL